jgi:5-methyltetrahydropteroyltriglutamate--homocysteine methyltransferase
MIQPLTTTVAGSFPVLPFYPVKMDFPPYTDEVPEGEPYVDDPFIPGIFESLRMQKEVGIEYPCYGQPQDMCSMFLGYLVGHGLEYKKGFQVVDDIVIPEKTPAIEYLQVCKRYFDFKGVKMPLTGPITLAATVKVGKKSGIEYPEIVEKLAEFVGKIAYEYDRWGAAIICVDEPSLVYGLYVGLEPEFCVEVIDRVVEKIRTAVSAIHVCGQMNPNITDILLSTKARMLDHEFAAIPENVDMYSREMLETHGKVVGYGCVISHVDPALLVEVQKDGEWQKVVEPVEVIKGRITDAINRWGEEKVILDPDCGFGGLKGYIYGKLTEEMALRICYEKLKNMVEAKKEIV